MSGGRYDFWAHLDFPGSTIAAGELIERVFWLPYQARIVQLDVLMRTKHGAGTYTLTMTRADTSATLLSGANFDMGTLTEGVITAVGLSLAKAVTAIPPGVLCIVGLTATDAFNGAGIYIVPRFRRGWEV